MTSPKAARLLVVAALSVPLLAGCDLGHPSGFTAGSNSYCRQTSTQIAKLARPSSPRAQLQYATDRYTLIERLVSELSDSSLPGGTTGSQLRRQWLAPARESLTEGRTVLAELRAAVNAHDSAAAGSQFSTSLAIGTGDVDTALLRGDRLEDCAKVFEPTVA